MRVERGVMWCGTTSNGRLRTGRRTDEIRGTIRMNPKVLALAAALLLPPAAAVVAYLGFSSEYQETDPLVLTGVVSKIEWMNPYTRTFSYAIAPSRKVQNWNFVFASLYSPRH